MDRILFFFRFFLIGFSSLYLLFLIANGMEKDFMPYNYILTLLINIYMILASRKNLLLFLILFVIGYSNYSFIYANYINHLSFTLYTQIISPEVTVISVNVITLFMCLMFLIIPVSHVPPLPNINVFIDEKNKDIRVCVILLLLMTIVFFIGFDTPDIVGQRGHVKPVYEYALSFFIVYFYFSGNNKILVRIGIIYAILYAGQNFIYGGRIYGLQFVLATFFMIFMHRVSRRTIFISLGVGFALFSIIGAIRGSILYSDASWVDILNNVAKNGFALDTAYSAYYTSESFVYISDLYETSQKLEYFKNFIVSIFMGSTATQDSQLAFISHRHMHHSNGGIVPYFFYFYLGTWSLIFPVLLIKYYLTKIKNITINDKGLIKCIVVFITAHSFRWYLYTPLGLLRGVLFLSIVYFGMYIVHNYRNKPYLSV